MKRNSCLSVGVVVLCVAVLGLCAVVRGDEVFTVTFTAPGALYQAPAFGTDSNGTDGIDNLDIGFQLPPFEQLTLRFSNNDYDGTLVKDIRGPGVAKTWVLEITNLGSGQSFTLSWATSDPNSFLADKTLTFTPQASPANAVNMKTTASTLISANGLYDIVLRQGNSEPVAMSDSVVMFKQSEASKLIDVLANDRDPDAGQTLSIVNFTVPANGTAAIENGKIRYTPNGGFTGPDTFSYTIQDNGTPALTASTSVAVQVQDQIYGQRTHAGSATPGAVLTVTLRAYFAASVTELRFLELLPTNGGSSWSYVANSATVTAGCTVTPQQTGNQLSLPVTGTLPATPGPVTVTYQITVPADTVVGTTKTLTGDLFVNGNNTAAVGTIPQSSFTINLYHSADYKNLAGQASSDWRIDFDELFQIIVLYNAGAYHIDATENSGYGPGAGNQGGSPHAADYKNAAGQQTPDWIIDFDELFQVIVLYNAGMYHVDPAENSGYGPGPAP